MSDSDDYDDYDSYGYDRYSDEHYGHTKEHVVGRKEPASAKQESGGVTPPVLQGTPKQQIEAALRNLEDAEKKVAENHLQTQQSVVNAYETLSQKLTSRRDALLKDVDNSLQHNMAAIREQKNTLQGLLNQVSTSGGNNMAIPSPWQPTTINFQANSPVSAAFDIGQITTNRQGASQSGPMRNDDEEENDGYANSEEGGDEESGGDDDGDMLSEALAGIM